jgi:hypothetical protein
LESFFEELTEEEKSYAYFQQGNTPVHSKRFSVASEDCFQ